MRARYAAEGPASLARVLGRPKASVIWVARRLGIRYERIVEGRAWPGHAAILAAARGILSREGSVRPDQLAEATGIARRQAKNWLAKARNDGHIAKAGSASGCSGLCARGGGTAAERAEVERRTEAERARKRDAEGGWSVPRGRAYLDGRAV